jgi:hypothetical protein
MKPSKPTAALAAGMFVLVLFHGTANAQFGFAQLPQDDFTWHWGDFERSSGFEDFASSGNDGRFRCELTGKLRPGSRMSRTDVREMETELRSSLEFVRSVANAMYILDQQRELDWATLVCKTPEPTEVSAEEKLERETKARERALRDLERRRARREREEGGTP